MKLATIADTMKIDGALSAVLSQVNLAIAIDGGKYDMKKDSIFDDNTPADYPCRKCEEVGIYCDEWDSRYCCTLC